MERIGGGSTKFVLSDRWIVYTKSRKQLLHRKYLLYETACIYTLQKHIYILYLHFTLQKNAFNKNKKYSGNFVQFVKKSSFFYTLPYIISNAGVFYLLLCLTLKLFELENRGGEEYVHMWKTMSIQGYEQISVCRLSGLGSIQDGGWEHFWEAIKNCRKN